MPEQLTADTNAVTVAFVPTVDDLLHAMPAIIRPRGRQAWWLGALLAMVVVNIVTRVARGGPDALIGFPGVSLLLVAGGIVGFLRVPSIVRSVVARQIRENPQLRQPLTYVFRAGGVRVESPVSTTEFPWTSFVRAEETQEFFRFHLATGSKCVVPRRALRETDEARLRALVSAHLGARAELMKPTDGR